MTSKLPSPPAGAGVAGGKVWRAILREYELAEHEVALLTQAVRVVDLCERLQVIVTAEGPMVTGRDGAPRVHPAGVELRMQRLALARLFATLRVPLDEAESPGRLQRRGGARGVYGLRGIA